MPGIPIPGARCRRSPPPPRSRSDRPRRVGPPARADRPGRDARAIPRARPIAPGQPRPPARLNRPLVLESVPAPGLPGPSPATNRDPCRPAPGPCAASPTTDPLPNRRPSGFLGRLLTPPTPYERKPLERGGSEAEESSPDLAADAALKRRVEHQVREAVGDRVRSVEVRVSGRHVSISARPKRFWLRRGVHRVLEPPPRTRRISDDGRVVPPRCIPELVLALSKYQIQNLKFNRAYLTFTLQIPDFKFVILRIGQG